MDGLAMPLGVGDAVVLPDAPSAAPVASAAAGWRAIETRVAWPWAGVHCGTDGSWMKGGRNGGEHDNCGAEHDALLVFVAADAGCGG
jgi:hypothetical protein